MAEGDQTEVDAVDPGAEVRRRPGRPRRLPIDEQRALVLRAARHVFAEHDFNGATIEAVAREAGVARPLVYDLFGGKTELFVAVVDDAVEQMIARFADQADLVNERSIRARVRGPVAAWFDFIREKPDVAAMVRIAEYGGFGPAKTEVAAGRQRIEDGLVAVYELMWAPFAPITNAAARVLALMTLSLVEAVGFRQAAEEAWDEEATVDYVTDFIVGGMERLYREPEGLTTLGRARPS